MKKIFQLLVVLALVLTVIGVAKSSSVWASAPAGADLSGANSSLPTHIVIAGSGNYNVGGVCTLDIQFKDASVLQVKADAEISIVESQKVPFSGRGDLFFPGCHVVHVKQDQVIRELSATDGTSKVCFGANPEMKMRIYYYLDKPFTTSQAWVELGTTLEDNGRLVCASAPYTGVYMPAGDTVQQPGSVIQGVNLPQVKPGQGSVVPPTTSDLITEDGTYTAGGICMLKVHYNVEHLSDTLHVEPPEFDTQAIPFPDNPDLLYFPGCHVIHFKEAQVKYVMTPQEGQWEVCFAARPGKVMTIYYYEYEDPAHKFTDPAHLVGPWKPLVTTTKDGLACAPGVDFTAVYTPAGH